MLQSSMTCSVFIKQVLKMCSSDTANKHYDHGYYEERDSSGYRLQLREKSWKAFHNEKYPLKYGFCDFNMHTY